MGVNYVFLDTPLRLNNYITILKPLLNICVFFMLVVPVDFEFKESILSSKDQY